MSAHVTSMRDALYEQPGPKTRRRIAIGTGIALLLVAIFILGIVRQFYVTGQLDPKYWLFFTRPTTWAYLAQGFWGTVQVSLVAGAISLALGLVFMLGRTSGFKPLVVVSTACIEFFRGVPSLLLIYFFFLVIPQYGIKMPAFWMICAPVALSASGVLAEVFRAGVNAVPRGQTEAAMSLGMSKGKTMFKIILPQAIRFVIPTLISQLVIVVKDTTLAYVVSFPDLLQNSRVLITNYDALVSTYFIVAIIYIILNYLINQAAVVIARRTGVKILRPE